MSKLTTPRETKPFRSRRVRVSMRAFVVLCLLLLVPGCALSQLATHVDWRVVVGVPLTVSVFTFLAYRSDKRRAEAGEWRIAESTLHLAELIGGWPGAFLAQRRFRHKTSKISYQVTFWIIVLVHQFLAADSINEWRWTKNVVRWVTSSRAH